MHGSRGLFFATDDTEITDYFFATDGTEGTDYFPLKALIFFATEGTDFF
jgi:hypothetical protein